MHTESETIIICSQLHHASVLTSPKVFSHLKPWSLCCKPLNKISIFQGYFCTSIWTVSLFYKGNVNSSTRKVRSQGPLSLHQTVGSGPPPSLQTPHSQLHSLNKLRSIHPTNWCCCYPCEWNTILGNMIISLNPIELVRPHNPKGQGFLTMAASSWPLCMRTALTSSVLRLQKAGSITVVSLRPKAIWESQQTKQNLHNCIRDQRFCRLTN